MLEPRREPAPRPRPGLGLRLAWVLLSALLIGWAFALGVLVGQGSLATPDQLATWQRWLASLPGMRDPAAPPPAQEAKPPSDLSFYQGLEGDAPAGKAAAPAAPSAPPAQAAPAAPAAPAAAAPPAPPVARPGEARYQVQVASLKEEALALGVVKRLKESGLPAYLVRAELKDVGVRYRVRVGPFASKDDAKEAAGRILLNHNLAAFVTSE